MISLHTYSSPFYISSLILNVTEICIILLQKKALSSSDQIVLSLAFGDAVLGLVGTLGFLIDIGAVPESKILSAIIIGAIFHSLSLSILTVLLLTTDRCLAVFLPFRQRQILSKRMVTVLIIGAWVVAFIISGVYFWLTEKKENQVVNYSYSTQIIFTFIVISSVYFALYKKVKRQSSTVHQVLTNTTSKTETCKKTGLRSISLPDINKKSNLTPNESNNQHRLSTVGKEDLEIESVHQSIAEKSFSTSNSTKASKVTQKYPKISKVVTDGLSVSQSKGTEGTSKEENDTSASKKVKKFTPLQMFNFEIAESRKRQKTRYRLQKERKILLLGSLIVSFFGISFLPSALLAIDGRKRDYSNTSFIVTYVLAISNSVSNPLLYFFYKHSSYIFCCKRNTR